MLAFCAIKTMTVSFVKRAVAGEVRPLLSGSSLSSLSSAILKSLRLTSGFFFHFYNDLT